MKKPTSTKGKAKNEKMQSVIYNYWRPWEC